MSKKFKNEYDLIKDIATISNHQMRGLCDVRISAVHVAKRLKERNLHVSDFRQALYNAFYRHACTILYNLHLNDSVKPLSFAIVHKDVVVILNRNIQSDTDILITTVLNKNEHKYNTITTLTLEV